MLIRFLQLLLFIMCCSCTSRQIVDVDLTLPKDYKGLIRIIIVPDVGSEYKGESPYILNVSDEGVVVAEAGWPTYYRLQARFDDGTPILVNKIDTKGENAPSDTFVIDEIRWFQEGEKQELWLFAGSAEELEASGIDRGPAYWQVVTTSSKTSATTVSDPVATPDFL